jgi:hypothetical protein
MFHAAKSPIMNPKNNTYYSSWHALLTGSWKVNYIGFGSYRDEWIARTEMKFKVRKQETRSRRATTTAAATATATATVTGTACPSSALEASSVTMDVSSSDTVYDLKRKIMGMSELATPSLCTDAEHVCLTTLEGVTLGSSDADMDRSLCESRVCDHAVLVMSYRPCELTPITVHISGVRREGTAATPTATSSSSSAPSPPKFPAFIGIATAIAMYPGFHYQKISDNPLAPSHKDYRYETYFHATTAPEGHKRRWWWWWCGDEVQEG